MNDCPGPSPQLKSNHDQPVTMAVSPCIVRYAKTVSTNDAASDTIVICAGSLVLTPAIAQPVFSTAASSGSSGISSTHAGP